MYSNIIFILPTFFIEGDILKALKEVAQTSNLEMQVDAHEGLLEFLWKNETIVPRTYDEVSENLHLRFSVPHDQSRVSLDIKLRPNSGGAKKEICFDGEGNSFEEIKKSVAPYFIKVGKHLLEKYPIINASFSME